MKSEGSVKGAEITSTMKRTTPNGEFVIVYKGKIDGSDGRHDRDADGRRRVEGRRIGRPRLSRRSQQPKAFVTSWSATHVPERAVR